jgi:hypothetical protein
VKSVSSHTLKIAVTTEPVTAHTESSNSSSGHTAVPLELRNPSEINSHSGILTYPLGTDHAQRTQVYCCVAQITLKTSHLIAISPVHWRADCYLATSYKHSSYCYVNLSQNVSIASRPGRFTPGTHCIGGWVGPRIGLYDEKILDPTGTQNLTCQKDVWEIVVIGHSSTSGLVFKMSCCYSAQTMLSYRPPYRK